eukprot:15463516-Alexandrium_andersonii.AAC.1
MAERCGSEVAPPEKESAREGEGGRLAAGPGRSEQKRTLARFWRGATSPPVPQRGRPAVHERRCSAHARPTAVLG